MAQALAVVLAAGKGTRMRSKTPKVLHKVGGRAMVDHVLAAAAEAGVSRAALVVGPEAPWAAGRAGDALSLHVQAEQKGTAHAVLAAREAFAADLDAVVVLFGDNPLVTAATIDRMVERVVGGADLAVLAFRTAAPTGYGRLLLDENGHVRAIREERDASEEERAVTLCNSGVMAIRAGAPLEALESIGADNAKGEYYLTDLVAIGVERGFDMVWEEASPAEVMGVNDRAQLAEAEAEFQRRARARALETATLIAPETVYFSHDTVIGEDVLIEPNVVFGTGVRVGDGATVHAFTHLVDTVVSPGAAVGPFARSRGGTSVGPGSKIGNFVELKNAALAPGVKISHLSYIGDAVVGAAANIGAGTITCNYDGVAKHRTEIGAGAFIGSNSALVAPVTIGEGAFVASGSVITEDVPANALALARGRQATKPDRSPLKPKS
ncbi:bifunctional UDP-N-acetylglucosamine diphosphorylase/glucosamine-1-phosphate N-acetyltransferase GlmU [Acuticoccus sp. I52.16.1]|uniref:bifunctional UDP-N-acetylglucosamine diphosphorylase/glucosamine-1-phosphate N-acetyltransferase GlmU n=1 Tax=Acuticoccus sp. I52.16.1 TaxID=2928472 RepID=UPI001FD486E5|nr:bifunctional UDP-N-acetylglucosamine diphosphorylase/glucosamine-1-phosphate N-acetyltransferase GlmU [Acuticoccus sp. I52.16.1]UOM34598.1 bifunctional UDP-N-acetylglucosamine diphosphorylase/glucosamine-1-phosphate N-acetyltransferase GlmU [Acuticoccus sp. I52.16.1]